MLHVLLPLLLAAPADRPIHAWDDWSTEQLEVTNEDIDGDGIPDRKEHVRSIGSGWKSFWTCVRDGATGHEACVGTHTTAYAPGYGVERWGRRPEGPNRAADLLLRPLDCEAGDPSRPTHASVWAPSSIGGEGTLVVDPTWLDGPPVRQARVCLTPEQAAEVPSAMVWEPSGEAVLDPERWTIVLPAPRSHALLQTGGIPPTPVLVAEGFGVAVYKQGHRLAVHDPKRDRHAWVVDLSAGGSFKTDRWKRIAAVEVVDRSAVRVTVRQMDPSTVLTVRFRARPQP